MKSRTRVKICGITREDDALAAVAAGADAIGFVFWARSPRCVDLRTACAIREQLPPFVGVVALFVAPQRGEVQTVLSELRPELLQFHGAETPQFCEGFRWPYIKAMSVAGRRDDIDLAAHPRARALLVDSADPVLIGGTGRRFDWELVPRQRQRPIVLAGGLDPGNVGEAIRQVRPFAVDVSSGVEDAPGRKSEAKLQAFMRSVTMADANRED